MQLLNIKFNKINDIDVSPAVATKSTKGSNYKTESIVLKRNITHNI